ncbi:hypothetical protein [Sorangium sp. So ce388]|uniref:hypothetical protein n=1 Tax=Sorangium sp. So ce388 TaxID=3133309 RepID=UPI003F5AECE0
MLALVGVCAAGAFGTIGVGIDTYLSQPPIAGQVLERETHKPVTQANVLLTGTPCRTNTNDQGYFELDCPKLRRISLEKAQVLIKVPETGQWCLGNVLGRLPRSHRFYISRTVHNCSVKSEVAAQRELDESVTDDGGALPPADADVEDFPPADADVEDFPPADADVEDFPPADADVEDLGRHRYIRSATAVLRIKGIQVGDGWTSQDNRTNNFIKMNVHIASDGYRDMDMTWVFPLYSVHPNADGSWLYILTYDDEKSAVRVRDVESCKCIVTIESYDPAAHDPWKIDVTVRAKLFDGRSMSCSVKLSGSKMGSATDLTTNIRDKAEGDFVVGR